ncbi:MAG: phosphatidylserine decarboxylase family protein [Bacteroidota bacterium]
MRLHKEGTPSIAIVLTVAAVMNFAAFHFAPDLLWLRIAVGVLSAALVYLILQFFRVPARTQTLDERLIIAPCDGKVVVIENTVENEYFKDKRLQVSIFMSPLNVHVNWYPISGKVNYLRYHEGKYLVAWHPKASSENERTTVVIGKENRFEILVRQIAGALARRIVYYPHQGDVIRQGSELGFIKFGSRVDLFLPVGTKLHVQIGQKTTGGVTVIGEVPA